MIKRIIFPVLTVLAAVSVILYADEKSVLSEPELVFNTGHSRDVYTVNFSANGQFLASGSADGIVKVWDAATGRELRVAGSHWGSVSKVKFSPDSRLLASCGRDKKIRIWSTADWRLLAELEGHDAWVKTLSFSPDSKMLASAGEEPEIIIWNTENWRKVKKLKEETDKVGAVAFSPDGKFLALGLFESKNRSSSDTVLIRDISSWSIVKTINRVNPSSICFSPDSKTIVVKSEIYSLPAGNKTGSLYKTQSIAFASDGKSIISAGILEGIFINDPVKGNTIAGIPLTRKAIMEIAIHPGGIIAAAAMTDGSIAYIDLKKRKEMKYLSDADTGFTARVYFKNDGTFAARKDGGKGLTLWNMIKGIKLNTFQVPEKNALCTFAENGKTFAYTGASGNIAVIDTETGKEIRSFREALSALNTIELNRDGSRLLVGLWKSIKLIDTATWKESIVLNPSNSKLAKLSPDSTLVASASGSPDYSITIYNTSEGRVKNVLKGHSNSIHCLDFSPDGKRLVSGSGEDHKDNSLRLWDVESGSLVRVFAKNGGFIYSAAFSPDGEKIAAVSAHRKVMLFDAGSGSSIAEFDGRSPDLKKILFSADSRKLLIGSSDGIIRIYDIEKKAIIALAGFADKNDYVLAASDGRYDATKSGIEKLHWVSGNEVIMLGDFDKSFNKKGLLPLLAGYSGKIEERAPDAVDVSKQLIGKIGAVSGREITVNSSRTLAMGDKIFLLSGGKKVPVEVTFPMMTVAKCKALNSSDTKKIKKGMPVFR